ncbi:MAG: hypothetical protein KF861_08465 [Planctomycetaceae bacterium]|nr:hypothetical protein [Planctomycetaceae bacterium]
MRPNRYEMQGNTLVQVVELNTPGITFPVVADPTITWFWWGYAVKYTKSETKSIATQPTLAAAAAVLCGFIPLWQAKAACVALAYIVINLYMNVFKSAAAHGNCVQVNYPFAPPPAPVLAWEVRC